MRIFKLTNPNDYPVADITTKKVIVNGKSTILVAEGAGSHLMRLFGDLKNEEYTLPKVKINNPTDSEINNGIVVIAPKGEVVVDRYAGADLLATYGFLIGEEYTEVSKGATKKVAKPKIKVAGKRK
jgi:hypothetical protein